MTEEQKTPTFDEIVAAIESDQQVGDTFKEASPEIKALAEKALKEVRSRSFSGRNPHLGKMIKCAICSLRHRATIKCEQRFKELFVEEDVETGEKTTIYATAVQPKGVEIVGQISAHQPTKRQVAGAAAFKGRRQNRHWSRTQSMFIERVRKLMGNVEIDLKSEVFQATLKIAREIAATQVRREENARARSRQRQQDISRRINYGLAEHGARA